MGRVGETPMNGLHGLPRQHPYNFGQRFLPEESSLPDGLLVSKTDTNNGPEHRSQYPTILWLTQSWLARDNRYERIATAGPRLGIGLIGQSLLEHHINLMPSIKSPADFVSIRNEVGGHIGFRVKIRTWPLRKRETMEVREIAA